KTPKVAAIEAVRNLADLRAPIAGVVIARANEYSSYNYGLQHHSSYVEEFVPRRGPRLPVRAVSAVLRVMRQLWPSAVSLIVFLRRMIRSALIILAIMLAGADIVSTLESRGTVVRSLDHILMLFGYDPKPWIQSISIKSVAEFALTTQSWPGWAFLAVVGVLIHTLIALGHSRRRRRRMAVITVT